MSNISNSTPPEFSRGAQFLHKLRVLLAALWLGNLFTVGYMVAPTLFASLADRALAGTIAGSMFGVQFWCSLALGSLLLILLLVPPAKGLAKADKALLILVLAMLALAIANHFGLRPEMAALREQAGGLAQMSEAMRSRFGLLHGISSVIYLAQSVCGVALLWRMR